MSPILSRQRGVFPLPSGLFAEKIVNPSSHISRAVQRRLIRQNKPSEWKNDAIDALNSLNGVSSDIIDGSAQISGVSRSETSTDCSLAQWG